MHSQEWFAVQVRSTQERRVADFLTSEQITTFLPERILRSKWSDRVKLRRVALFPGYLFAQLDMSAGFRIVRFQGVKGLVQIAGKPAVVDRSEIDALQILTNAEKDVAPHPFVAAGQRVQVVSGPFKDACGMLIRAKNSKRLIVSITLLNRAVAVELDEDTIIESCTEDSPVPNLGAYRIG